MKQFEKRIQEIFFNYSMMIRFHDTDRTLWGLFSKPSNQGKFEWFHTKENGNWVSIQPRINSNWRKIQDMALPFEECLKMACEYDDFCLNSEVF